jgi:hypothetical protein
VLDHPRAPNLSAEAILAAVCVAAVSYALAAVIDAKLTPTSVKKERAGEASPSKL